MNDYRVYVVPPHSRSRFYRLRWHLHGRPCGEKSAKTDNAKLAKKLAAQLEADLNAGRFSRAQSIPWADFCQRYEQEHLAFLSEKSRNLWNTTRKHVEHLMRWSVLSEATADAVSTFQSRLRRPPVAKGKPSKPLSINSIASYLRTLRAALNWATDTGILPDRCKVSIPRTNRNNSAMRGRPIKLEEFERMLTACVAKRPEDFADWQRFMTGLWLSGARLGEGLRISWDVSARMSIDQTGKHFRLRMFAESHKGRRDQYLPLTPDFETWLLQTPEIRRRGRAFGPVARLGLEYVSSMIADIGEAAGVVVDRDKGTHATAQDFRRSFGTRWAARVKPARLQLLMRHKDISTTMQFYVAEDSDDVADDLWRDHHSVASQLPVSKAESTESCGTSYGT